MKRNFLKIFTLASLLFVTAGCNNLLEIKETDFLGGDVALRTVANNESLLIGAYAVFSPEMTVLLNGVFSDEIRYGEFYNAQTTHEWQYAPNDVGIRDSYTAIDPLYKIVDRTNRIFKALPNAVAANPAEEEKKKLIRGEALFLRAYAHFELFRYYCKNYDPAGLAMIYMTEPSLTAQARENMGSYFEKMLTDITEAKSLMAPTSTDIYRANRLAAVALHARVALYMRNWKDAITYSTEFIAAKPLATRAEFPGIWSDKNNVEQSFKLSRVVPSRIGSLYRGSFTKNAAGALVVPTSISWIPSSKLWNSFDQTNDIRFASYLIDEPLLAAVVGKPSKIVNKYQGGGYAAGNEMVNDVKVFRTGEMYLIRAEARAEDGAFTGANSAESDLNALRAARIQGYTNQTFASKDVAITAVMAERFKELAFEGHRFFDLKRRGLAVERLAVDAPSASGSTLPANDFRFVLPIPHTERAGNPLMVQNEGYN